MNGLKSMAETRFGETMRKYILALTLLAVTAKGADCVVRLPSVEIPQPISDSMFLPHGNQGDVKLPFALGMLGEPDAEYLADTFGRVETVVAATITSVVPICFACLDDGIVNQLIWYRVEFEVNAVMKGSFPSPSFKFVTCWGHHRNVWPYVKGFCYHLGMDFHDGEWNVVEQARACPFPPYNLADHVRGWVFLQNNPDAARWKELIGKREKLASARCLDIAIENNKYLIMTFPGEELFGGLDVDYGSGVRIEVYSLENGDAVSPTVLPWVRKDLGVPDYVTDEELNDVYKKTLQ